METFWFFRLQFRRAYDSAYDSNSDSVASENQPLLLASRDFVVEMSAIQRQKFHTDNENQCLDNLVRQLYS